MSSHARRIRTSRPSRHALALVAAAAVSTAGCGGGDEHAATTPPPQPRLARPLADDLARRSVAIAEALDAGDVCTAAVRADELKDATVQAINAGRVPAAFQEPLMARANELVNAVNCPQPEPAPAATQTETEAGEEPSDGNGNGNGKAKGKKKKKKDKDDEFEVITIPPPEANP